MKDLTNKTGIIVGGFELKTGRKIEYYDETNAQTIHKVLPDVPSHNFSKDAIVNIIGNRKSELICESNGMKQNIKRKFVKVI
jgi:hypothetical protein